MCVELLKLVLQLYYPYDATYCVITIIVTTWCIALLLQDPESFLHRSGRTGRAGKTGTTVAMVTPLDDQDFRRILKETNTGIISMLHVR